MTIYDVHGMRAIVVGAARSGIAAAELLATRGARVVLSDARADVPGAARLCELGVTLELGGHVPATFAQADCIVMSPGVPPELPVVARARAAGVPTISEIELASRFLQGKVIAVTGTKGKSTTTTLIGRILRQAGRAVTVGGNIGTPLSGQVAQSTPETLHVVECSSFQLELIDRFHPWVAVLLNLSADHLDRHPSLEAYAAAKARIFERQTLQDHAVVNAEDARVRRLAADGRAHIHAFSRRGATDAEVFCRAEWIMASDPTGEYPLMPLEAIQLLGPHLIDDVLAAVAVARLVDVPPSVMREAVHSFAGLEHAMELVAESGGVRFVNDSKATNVDAALRAIESFESGVVAIIGGRFKGGDLRLLRSVLGARAAAVVAIGEATPLVHEALDDIVPVHDARTMVDAVAQGQRLAPANGVVLLAPACASFDMFKDYAERGDRFRDAVHQLVSRLEMA